MSHKATTGRVQDAPENFLDAGQIAEVQAGRRDFLRNAFLAAGTLAAAPALAQDTGFKGEAEILELPAHSKGLGQPVAARGYGSPSQFEQNLQRRESPGLTRVSAASVSFTPLQGLFGIITPNGLHFERHHQGWWDIDPNKHRLMVMGMVKQPKVYTMDDLMRLPAVSRMHFIECGANTGMEWGNVAVPTVQYTHGMLSCCEYTGVLLSTLLEDCGFDRKNGKYVLAEGADGSGMTRTLSMDRALDDVMVAWAMNGEMLRPENGYPVRLVAPGLQGVSWVKWLRRIEVGDQPWGTKDETLHYIDLMPDGVHRQYSSIQECKSVITSPSGGQTLLDKGFHNVTGLAWSGRGRIKRVDVSFDGGRNWKSARLESLDQPKCLRRFNIDWVWDGGPAILQSRAIDDTGYVQPKINQLRAVRGSRSIYHNNAIQSWKVADSGEVSNVQVSRAALALLIWVPAYAGMTALSFAGMTALSFAGMTALLFVIPAKAGTQYPGVGRPATPAEVAAWDIDVRPDFKGLPPGSGSVKRGQEVWEAKCESCHGTFGESNEVFAPIVGGTTQADIQAGRVKALVTGDTARTTLMKLSTLSTLWDYVNRAMPWNAPKTLTTEEVYAVVAYILHLGEILPADYVLSDRNIAEVQKRLPNRNGVTRNHALWDVKARGDVTNTPCMKDCVSEIRTASALPEYAQGAHGNLAEQNRLVGAVRGTDHAGAPAVAKVAAPAGPGELARRNNCFACHAVDKRVVGPSFLEVAARYKGAAGSDSALAGKLRAGGSGAWGSIPMPPNPDLAETDAKTLAQWILSGSK